MKHLPGLSILLKCRIQGGRFLHSELEQPVVWVEGSHMARASCTLYFPLQIHRDWKKLPIVYIISGFLLLEMFLKLLKLILSFAVLKGLLLHCGVT